MDKHNHKAKTIGDAGTLAMFGRAAKWMRSHKFLTAVGATATAGAAAYVFKDAISTALKPVSDRLVQYTLEQVMISVKNESKAEARQERFKETGEVARQAAFVFLPQIGRELRTRLDKKGILKKLRDCNKEAKLCIDNRV